MSRTDPRESDPRHVTFVFVPDGSRGTRQLRISVRTLRRLLGVGAVVFAFLCVMIGSWWYLMGRARQAAVLEVQVADLLDREVQVDSLARRLAQIETSYEGIRALFGSEATAPAGGELWLPPTSSGRTGRASGSAVPPGDERLPRSWPLTESGAVTQERDVVHPGIDIAVPAGSYIRASGSGVVVEVGTDSIYGNYLILDHGDGWRSLYGHASRLLVEVDDQVRRNEVIAASGSSGRSTGPHLHFEILRNGERVDPLTMVTRP